MRYLAVTLTLALANPALALDPTPSNPTDMRYTKPDGTVSTDPTQIYGPLPYLMGAGRGFNTLYVSNWNDARMSRRSFA